jgi:hypothetical protein
VEEKMKMKIDINTEELPPNFKYELERNLLKVIPRSHKEKSILTVSVEKARSKYLLNLQIRGQQNKSFRCKDYNPYLLVKTCCIKLKSFYEKQENALWRENEIRLPSFGLVHPESLTHEAAPLESNARI